MGLLAKIPLLKGLPQNTQVMILLLVTVNLLIWIAVSPVLHYHPKLAAPAALSYTLGLRHALDADHIAAIDLTTRRLIASGQRPATVGTFFSLGHSTVVIITCVVVAATSGALRERFDDFARVGNIIGTSISAVFLIVLCAGNGWVLYKLIKRIREALACQMEHGEPTQEAAAGPMSFEGVGFLSKVFGKLFKAIDRPWKMYPLGLIFGLGFDTSSEIAILGIASIQAVQGTSIWLILIFPILFTGRFFIPLKSLQVNKLTIPAGMCLLDTTDGALMLALYTSKAFSRDPIAILYYSAILTGITVLVSAFIGIVQVLALIQNVAKPEGPFWDGVDAIGEHFDIIGGCICAVFVLVGVGSIFVYRPWRNRMERKDQTQVQLDDDEEAARPPVNISSPLLQ